LLFNKLNKSPFRPNPIQVKNFDILDKTPVLFINPYSPQFAFRETNKIGWVHGKIKKKTRASFFFQKNNIYILK